MCFSSEILFLLSKNNQLAWEFLKNGRGWVGTRPTRYNPRKPKAKSQSFYLTSVKGLKLERASWVAESTGGKSYVWEEILSSICDHAGKAFMWREPLPRPPNIKLTHVSGRRPESSNFGGSGDTQFSVFCLTGLSRIVIGWQITPPIHKDSGVARAIHYGLKAVAAWIKSQW